MHLGEVAGIGRDLGSDCECPPPREPRCSEPPTTSCNRSSFPRCSTPSRAEGGSGVYPTICCATSRRSTERHLRRPAQGAAGRDRREHPTAFTQLLKEGYAVGPKSEQRPADGPSPERERRGRRARDVRGAAASRVAEARGLGPGGRASPGQAAAADGCHGRLLVAPSSYDRIDAHARQGARRPTRFRPPAICVLRAVCPRER